MAASLEDVAAAMQPMYREWAARMVSQGYSGLLGRMRKGHSEPAALPRRAAHRVRIWWAKLLIRLVNRSLVEYDDFDGYVVNDRPLARWVWDEPEPAPREGFVTFPVVSRRKDS